jgi:hypothetical protein
MTYFNTQQKIFVSSCYYIPSTKKSALNVSLGTTNLNLMKNLQLSDSRNSKLNESNPSIAEHKMGNLIVHDNF